MSSLLPPNSTKLEKSLEYSSARVETLAVPFIELNRFSDCPESHLPWLAWEHRVEYWQPNWTEQQKRKAIQDAKIFNAQRGTRASLKALINTVISDYEIVAWHQQTPKGQPYTFVINVSETTIISIDQLAQLHTAVDSTKSQRDLYGVNANVKTTGNFIIAGAVITGEQVLLTSQ
ncbi:MULTISPECIES: phage tail protein I [unclassified Acinetobacter]|uniref:phage tail protein I n=1 Tax=unclassified Acinetobacter TaxID=196816 RepID=UPI0022AC334C|nr:MULTISPECIES: phage tail protein I [unclassified Acinetobacter]WAU72953.1 phage tail protein I [Acinetobacter sp. TR11]WAU76048.1 phage tail protein I [Acinetobacter sp. TR3]